MLVNLERLSRGDNMILGIAGAVLLVLFLLLAGGLFVAVLLRSRRLALIDAVFVLGSLLAGAVGTGGVIALQFMFHTAASSGLTDILLVSIVQHVGSTIKVWYFLAFLLLFACLRSADLLRNPPSEDSDGLAVGPPT